MLVVSVTFGIGILVGLYITIYIPSVKEQIEHQLVTFSHDFEGLSRTQLAIAIFANNIQKAFTAISLGMLFGVVPVFFIFVNGVVLGVVGYLVVVKVGWTPVMAAVLPHGVVEIPAILLAGGVGLWLGVVVYKKLRKVLVVSFKKEIQDGLYFFVGVLVPLFFIAAIIEAFLTTALVDALFIL